MRSRIAALTFVLSAVAIVAAEGCQQPTKWAYTGPRVYLIGGAAGEGSDGLSQLRDDLHAHQINAKVYSPDNWLQVVADIDALPHEEAILVGHGHGAFLCTQVVRHYAQEHKTKFIEAVFTIDAYNKDWPHSMAQRGCCGEHARPGAIPIGHNALRVENYTQANQDSKTWGSGLVSTRASNLATRHPFYWYDNYWCADEAGNGAPIGEDLTSLGVVHETIDNEAGLMQRILRQCRKAALSPYHYTPPEHHPDVPPQVTTADATVPAPRD